MRSVIRTHDMGHGDLVEVHAQGLDIPVDQNTVITPYLTYAQC